MITFINQIVNIKISEIRKKINREAQKETTRPESKLLSRKNLIKLLFF